MDPSAETAEQLEKLKEETKGQEFVPVAGTKVLMCRTPTRVRDFRAYAEAASYRQALGIKPKDEDARHNLALALRMLKNPPPKKKDDKKDKNKQDKKENKPQPQQQHLLLLSLLLLLRSQLQLRSN